METTEEEAGALLSLEGATSEGESTVTTPSLAERDQVIRGRDDTTATGLQSIRTILSPLSSASLESPTSRILRYKVSIDSSYTESFSEEGDNVTSFSRTVFSDDDLQSSQSQSYSIETVSTETTQPTSPGRWRQDYPISPVDSSGMTEMTLSFEDGATTDASTTFDEDESTVPSVPSLDGIQNASSTSSHESSRKAKVTKTTNNPRRIPGGAAAKLMFMGPSRVQSEDAEDDDEEANKFNEQMTSKKTGTDDQVEIMLQVEQVCDEAPPALQPSSSQESVNLAVVAENMRELELSFEKTRAEFDKGPESNRRYREPTIHEDLEEVHSSAAPSFLNRSEIFHESVEAAIASLLAPRDRTGDGASVFSSYSELASIVSSGTMSAFQAPRMDSSYAETAPMQPFESLARRDVGETLILPETEKKLREMPSKMHDPNKTLTDLLTAIASPEDKSTMDLGYMVRRKNACGALQVLTANTKNRKHICWTIGVLPALTSVLADTGDEGLKIAFPDNRIRIEFEEARKRAISALMNLAMPKENRIPVFHTPDLISWIVVVIVEDEGAARRGCCAILAYLGKSPENRLLLVQVPGLVDTFVQVLRPKSPCIESPRLPPKKIYPWQSADDSESSFEGNRTRKNSFSSQKQEDSDSDHTPRVHGTLSPIELSGYDETADEFLRGARQNVFALLSHLIKEKDNAYYFVRNSPFVSTLVAISKYNESPSHVLAVKLLAHMTRHRLNTKPLVFKHRIVVPALIIAVKAIDNETRLYACYALQNLSQDKSCRQELAISENLITVLCNRSREASADEERLAAVSVLKNLCDEPDNLVPLTNTPDCISSLLRLANNGDEEQEGVSSDDTVVQYRARDGLATLSHWLRKIATSGKTLDDARMGKPPTKDMFVPSLRVIRWNQWE